MSLTPIVNAMSVDVEDYFHVTAFKHTIARNAWDTIPLRVEARVEMILDLFSEKNVTATFFVLGWLAEKLPWLVKNIAERGHEIGCHSYWHEQIHNLTHQAFKQDCRKAKEILEDITGNPVLGYRAPSYSLNAKTTWAYAILAEIGFKYSSSVYPIVHDLYGWKEAPRFIFKPGIDNFLELPITTFQWLKRNWPCGGGGYFRFFPYRISKWGIEQVNQKENNPCIFYFHPWELDFEQPRQASLPLKSRIRHYVNLKRMQIKLQSLLQDFQWDSLQNVFIKGNTSIKSFYPAGYSNHFIE